MSTGGPLFLGLDSSTQSLKATVIDSSLQVMMPPPPLLLLLYRACHPI
jgi:hypothetical protein